MVRDSGVAGLAVREFIWGLKMLRDKANLKMSSFLFLYLQGMEIHAFACTVFQRSGICRYNHGFTLVLLEAG